MVAVASRYEIGKVIGKGAFASVRRAEHRETGNKVAIKIIDRKHDASDAESLAQEISCMQRIEHPNCVMLHEVDPPNVPSISAKCPRDRLMWVLVGLVQRAREGDCAWVRAQDRAPCA